MKMLDKIKKFVVMCLSISILGVVIMNNITEGKSPIETTHRSIEPIKDFKIKLIGNSAVVTWKKSKDKRVIGYSVGYFNNKYENIGQKKISYENRCVFVDLPLNIELWFVVNVNGYDEKEGYIYSYPCPVYYGESSPSLDEYKVVAKDKTDSKKYAKLSKEAKEYDIPLVKVKDIKANPEKYLKKVISLSGKLYFKGVIIPNSGCGYFTDDTGGLIFIDVNTWTRGFYWKAQKLADKENRKFDSDEPYPGEFVLTGRMNYADRNRHEHTYSNFFYQEKEFPGYMEYLKLNIKNEIVYFYFDALRINEIEKDKE